MIKALILADTGRAYSDFLRVYRLNRLEYPWIHDAESLHGYKNKLLIRYGEWYNVLDKDMLDYMENHGIDMVSST